VFFLIYTHIQEILEYTKDAQENTHIQMIYTKKQDIYSIIYTNIYKNAQKQREYTKIYKDTEYTKYTQYQKLQKLPRTKQNTQITNNAIKKKQKIYK